MTGEPRHRRPHEREFDEARVRAGLEDGGSVPSLVDDKVAGFVDIEHFQEPAAARDRAGFGIVNEFLQFLPWVAFRPQRKCQKGAGAPLAACAAVASVRRSATQVSVASCLAGLPDERPPSGHTDDDPSAFKAL